ncbi:MAG: asparagine synthase (glutamine-hydrolyzing) [Thermoleophilaceae bacterium]
MCGICGSTDDPSGGATAAMSAALRHRGPDDSGLYSHPDSGVALGAQRLAIIDVEGGHQPLSNEDGSVWAILNGEIYNHPALRERLRDRGHSFRSLTDTEVLVHLYEEYGQAMVHALEGMFAFAVWDERQRRLLIARDRFGEKPLFYRCEGNRLSFASELGALLGAAGPAPELEPDAVNSFFVFGYVPGPGTIVRGVHQLPPAHLLTWRRDAAAGPEVRSYWSPPTVSHRSPEPLAELTAETGRLLHQSIGSRMIADVPLGVFLSGGVDSSLIATLAARHSAEPVKTFTVGYDVGSVDESATARRVARHVGAEHHELRLTCADVAERVPAVLAALDQPLADQALVPLNAVAEFARASVTTVIAGEGADELFGGYPRYRWLHRAEALDGRVPHAVGALGARAVDALPVRDWRVRRLVDVAVHQPPLERHLDWVTDRRRHLRARLYGPALQPQHLNGAITGDLASRVEADHPGIAEMMRLDQLHWLPDNVLMKADRASMLVGLEVRTPYLNRELAEFAATVSPLIHTRMGGKALLRGLLGRLLPRGGAPRRRKTAFRVPAEEWLRGPLAHVVHRQLTDGTVFEEGWFDRAQARQIVIEHSRGVHDWTHVLWPLLSFGVWLDRFRGRDGG